MKHLLAVVVCLFFSKLLNAAELNLFDKEFSVPKTCVHYVVPNRYLCKTPYAQVETAELSFVEEFFGREDLVKNLIRQKVADSYDHFFAKSSKSEVEGMYYAICKNSHCILVVSDSEQAFNLWLSPLSQPLIQRDG